MELFVLPKELTLANCRLSLNTAWLVMHSQLERKWRWESLRISHEAESLPACLSTQLLALVFLYIEIW